MKLRTGPHKRLTRISTSPVRISGSTNRAVRALDPRAALWDGVATNDATLGTTSDPKLTAKQVWKAAIATALLGMALLNPLQQRRTTLAPPPPPVPTSTLQKSDQPTAPGVVLGGDPGLEDIELVANGVRLEAVAEALHVIESLRVEPRFQRPFKRAQIVVVIIPDGTSLTALPEFAALKGTTTFDGRLWDDVRGVGGHACHKGKICVAVPEENLAHLSSDPYGANSIAMHELTHAVFDYVVGKDVRSQVTALFQKRTTDALPFVTDYASKNAQEYWAESTNAYFSRLGGKDTAWLRQHDPQLFAIFQTVYGPPPTDPTPRV